MIASANSVNASYTYSPFHYSCSSSDIKESSIIEFGLSWMEQTTAAADDGGDGCGGRKIMPSIEEFFTVVYTFLNGDM